MPAAPSGGAGTRLRDASQLLRSQAAPLPLSRVVGTTQPPRTGPVIAAASDLKAVAAAELACAGEESSLKRRGRRCLRPDLNVRPDSPAVSRPHSPMREPASRLSPLPGSHHLSPVPPACGLLTRRIRSQVLAEHCGPVLGLPHSQTASVFELSRACVLPGEVGGAGGAAERIGDVAVLEGGAASPEQRQGLLHDPHIRLVLVVGVDHDHVGAPLVCSWLCASPAAWALQLASHRFPPCPAEGGAPLA